MKKIYDICCGIDVHKKLMVACLIHGGQQETRKFGATTRELLGLAGWLSQSGCQMAAMESTGSYWKPLYNILEASGLDAMVVNAQHMRALPGRKTDVKDAEWIADLLQHGLLKASYIPGRAQRELRELVSYRKSLSQDRASELNRLQKVLEGANIKLSGTVSNIAGKSARSILDTLVSGEPIDSEKYDDMLSRKQISGRLKAPKEQILEDLNGVMSPLQRQMLRVLLSHVDELDAHIRELDMQIGSHMGPDERQATELIQGVPGIAEASARAVVSIIGTDMSRFPTAARLASWAGLCPGNNESAGKRKSGKTRKGNRLLRSTLVTCAHAAIRNKHSYFYAQYKRVSARRGGKRAIVAVAHSMLTAVYHILKDGVCYQELGADYYSQFNRERKVNSYLKKLKALGWEAPTGMAVQPA